MSTALEQVLAEAADLRARPPRACEAIAQQLRNEATPLLSLLEMIGEGEPLDEQAMTDARDSLKNILAIADALGHARTMGGSPR